MESFNDHILSILIFFPIFLALGLLTFDEEDSRDVWGFALIGSAIQFLISLHLVFHYIESPAMQFVETVPWIPRWGITYLIGADGFSIPLIILATLLTPIVFAASVSSITKFVRLYAIAFLVLESAMIGSMVALDLFLFYVFWELMLIPMFMIIGIWGGKRRIYATVKFVLYTILEIGRAHV